MRSLSSRLPHKIIIAIVESIFYVALTLTYSRAGFLALLAAAATYIISRKLSRLHTASLEFSYIKEKLHKYATVIGACAIFFSVAVVYGAYSRFLSWLWEPDKSLLNRFAVWLGAFQILADNPSGTGAGLSGKIYTLFYQDELSHEAYRSMVNSFLTLAVEHGITCGVLILSLLLCSIVFMMRVCLSNRLPERQKIIPTVFLSASIAALVDGTASTCFDLNITIQVLSFSGMSARNDILQTLLLILFIITISGLLAFCFIYRQVEPRIMRLMLYIFFISSIGLPILFYTSVIKGKNISIRYEENKAYLYLGQESKSILLMADDEQIKMMSSILKSYYPEFRICIPLTQLNTTDNILSKTSYIVLCGKQSRNEISRNDERLIVLLPSVPPPSYLSSEDISSIILQHDDPESVNYRWEQRFNDKIKFLTK